LQVALHQSPPLRLAVLFGSAAIGDTRPDSDVDVAILASGDDLDDARERTLANDLTRAARCEVDLVRIERASTVLRWQIATKGVALIEAAPGEFARFRARAAAEYLDFEPRAHPPWRSLPAATRRREIGTVTDRTR
jgi:predicted nucleotidyltransferase